MYLRVMSLNLALFLGAAPRLYLLAPLVHYSITVPGEQSRLATKSKATDSMLRSNLLRLALLIASGIVGVHGRRAFRPWTPLDEQAELPSSDSAPSSDTLGIRNARHEQDQNHDPITVSTPPRPAAGPDIEHKVEALLPVIYV